MTVLGGTAGADRLVTRCLPKARHAAAPRGLVGLGGVAGAACPGQGVASGQSPPAEARRSGGCIPL